MFPYYCEYCTDGTVTVLLVLCIAVWHDGMTMLELSADL